MIPSWTFLTEQPTSPVLSAGEALLYGDAHCWPVRDVPANARKVCFLGYFGNTLERDQDPVLTHLRHKLV